MFASKVAFKFGRTIRMKRCLVFLFLWAWEVGVWKVSVAMKI